MRNFRPAPGRRRRRGLPAVLVTTAPELKQTTSAMLARAGAATLIGLDLIRQRAGARWPKMRETIYQRMETILRQKLGAQDFFIRIEEVSYLVTIPATEPEDAQVCCLRVAYELHTSLLGPCTIDDLRISRAVDAGNGTLMVTPIVAPQILRLAERADIPALVATGTEAARTEARRRDATAADRKLHAFVPVWDSRAEAITAYRCIVEADEDESALLTPSAKARAALSLALTGLGLSVAVLDARLARGERFLVHLRVPYEALTSPLARMEFVSACRGLSQQLRPLLVFEIVDLPAGVPQSRLQDLVTTVRPFGRAVSAELPLRYRGFSAYHGLGLQAIGLDLAGLSDVEAKGEIDRLAAGTRGHNLPAFLSGIATRPVLAAALAAGVPWLSGPAVAAGLEEPGPMIRLYTDELLGRTRAAQA
jgi:hypothetical protein